MARVAHFLRENRGGRLPQLIVGVDTETDELEVSPDTIEARLAFGWAAVIRRHRGLRWTPPRWLRFTTPAELWEWLDTIATEHRRVYLVAHNVGFDFRVLDGFAALPARGWTLRGSVIEDPPTILRYRRARSSLVVADTLNWHRSSLAQLGAQLGLPKLDMPPDWTDRAAADAYCRRDVEIVLGAMTGLVERVARWDLGNFAPTLPGQAYAAFRHRHLASPILIDTNGPALTLARSGYYGGRTEAYRLGPIDGPVAVYDVVSMYPSVMASTPMPTVLRGYYRSITTAELAALPSDVSALADVTLTTDVPAYPTVGTGRLVFPVGTFRTVLPDPELRAALAAGHVRRVHASALYDAAVVFDTFVAEWWARRLAAIETGATADAYFAKLVLNSLYGKFGQRGEVYEPVGPDDPERTGSWIELDADTGTVHRYRSVGGLRSELIGETEGRESHPAIAATVTSAARLRLWRLMLAVGRRWIVYTDTDSLFVRSGAPRASLAALVGPGLGELRHERTIEALTIYGLKDYRADDERKIKGVRRDAIELAPGSFRQDMFVGLKGAVAAGDVHRQLIRSIVRTYGRTYGKGTVSRAGIVRPYRFG